MVAVSTCSLLLKEIAVTTTSGAGQCRENSNNNTPEDKDHERLVSSSLSSSLSWTAATSSLPLRSIVQACWTTIQRMLLTVPSGKNQHSPSLTPLPPNTNGGEDMYKDENEDKARTFEWERFVSTITRRSDHVARGLMRQSSDTFYENEEQCDEYYGKGATDVLSSFLVALDLVPRDMAALVLVLLQQASILDCDRVEHETVQSARIICNSLFWTSSTEHQEAITEHLVFNSKASVAGFRTSSERLRVFSQHLASIADRWSQWTFLQEAEGRLQHHVSLILWRGLVRLESLPQTKVSSLSLSDPSQRKLTTALVNGVSHRLGSTLMVPRQDGMRIAQQVAKGLGQQGGLQFDEFIPDDDDSSTDDDEDGDVAVTTNVDRNQPKKATHGFVDPDEDYDSEEDNGEITDSKTAHHQLQRNPIGDSIDKSDDDDDDDDELSLEWEDELVPYDLEDDEEDLRQTPRPLHLLEALDLLRTGDNHDHAYSRHEAALDALPGLIRTQPDDLGDVAVSLALQLLRMEDKFDIENFGFKREAAMRALLVEEPMSVGQTLIEQLFEESGLSDKLTIIACLQSAAFEFSGNKTLVEAMLKKAEKTTSSGKMSLSSDTRRHDKIVESHKDQASRVLSKTRRKRSRGEQKSIRNLFSNVAPMWFYSLIAGFIKHKEDEILWTGSTGSIFLTYFLRCLSTIVEFSGIQVSKVLANDLLDLVWDFRTADVAEVRLSVLVAVSTSIAMLSDEKLTALLFGEASLSKTMLEMSQNDPDKECRSLCKTISYSIHEVVKNNY
eukprot:jgi/Psemu1/241477/estExt_Genewise1.C_2280038